MNSKRFTSQVPKVGKHLFNTSLSNMVSEMPKCIFSQYETIDSKNYPVKHAHEPPRGRGAKNTEQLHGLEIVLASYLPVIYGYPPDKSICYIPVIYKQLF